MAKSNPLDVLRRGLKALQKRHASRREKLLAQVKAKTISSEDEYWLDHDGNAVEETQVLDILERASDYEKAYAQLDDKLKAAVQRLREFAGDIVKISRKRKRRCHVHQFLKVSNKFQETEKEDKAQEQKVQVKEKATPIFTKKENATLAQRIEILDWHHKNGKNQKGTAAHFDKCYPNLKLTQPLISKWLKDEGKWRKQWGESRVGERDSKRIRQVSHLEVEEMMDLWVSKAMEKKILLTGEVLRVKWKAFAELVGIPEDERLNLSEGWLGRFKARHGLKEIRRHGEAASADLATVEQERCRIQELIAKYGYKLQDIFNMDETGMFYGHVPYTLLGFQLS
jgi:hypothetical protein